MQKIETIWHHLLWDALENKNFHHTQKALSINFGYSLSTVNAAVKKVAEIGAVEISGKFFTLKDAKKLLYYWATHRKLVRDIIYKTHVSEPVVEIEGLVPAETIFGGYLAGQIILGETPADYSKVYIYFNEAEVNKVITRFPPVHPNENLFVLRSFSKQKDYGEVSSLPQTFVDLWNLSDWYAKDYLIEMEKKIDGLLLL